jgi:hypothetical protein
MFEDAVLSNLRDELRRLNDLKAGSATRGYDPRKIAVAITQLETAILWLEAA